MILQLVNQKACVVNRLYRLSRGCFFLPGNIKCRKKSFYLTYCFIITSKKLTDGTIVNFEFAIKLVGKALELANELGENTYLRITNAKLSNKKDERFTSSYKKTQIVVYDAEIISQEEFENSQRSIVTVTDAETEPAVIDQ